MHDEKKLSPDAAAGRFESDTKKLLHRHLQDRNHIISDEELKSLRVGMMPSAEVIDNIPGE